eukprot:CAMPEP_0205830842 /NCGR_PEP_ID=MMETSP0206-20130828/42295_1 /ASSEMBLY_ACC=CAM_ASM_000279 /TAXON_ID=36767 /ORGANISM="Euplotes focardii, Strain TN1" /LENGTH=256 /DNA_ID=CAMNT_0053134865 /DNA_START=24 /DNA_END=791 /DNA_ORIENTATION=-
MAAPVPPQALIKGAPPAGKLSLRVLRGRNLTNMDMLGKQDPYVRVTVGGMTKKTQVIKKGGKDPEWTEYLDFETDGKVDSIAIEAKDADPLKDDLIGTVELPLDELINRGAKEHWYTVQRKGKDQGEVALACDFEPFLTGQLTVTLHKAEDLANMDFGKQDPYVVISLDKAKGEKSTVIKKGGRDPVWNNERFLFQLNGKERWLNVKLYDKDMIKDDYIGGARVELRKLYLDTKNKHPGMCLKVGRGDIFEDDIKG